MRRAVARVLASWDRAGAKLRAYATEPVPAEPEPTIPAHMQRRLALAEAQRQRVAELEATLEATLAASAARLDASAIELARVDAERHALAAERLAAEQAAEQACEQAAWDRRRAHGWPVS